VAHTKNQLLLVVLTFISMRRVFNNRIELNLEYWMYIGLNSLADDTTQSWHSEEPFIYSNWFTGEPGDFAQDCGAIQEEINLFRNNALKWTDVRCDLWSVGLCELPLTRDSYASCPSNKPFFHGVRKECIACTSQGEWLMNGHCYRQMGSFTRTFDEANALCESSYVS